MPETETTTYRCEECGREFPSSPSLQMHVLRKHQGMGPQIGTIGKSKPGMVCPTCHRRFNDRPSLLDHIQRRHNGAPAEPGLARPRRSPRPQLPVVTAVEPALVCPECQATFKRPKAFHNHVLRHSRPVETALAGNPDAPDAVAYLYACRHLLPRLSKALLDVIIEGLTEMPK